jgi:hypothetical protein
LRRNGARAPERPAAAEAADVGTAGAAGAPLGSRLEAPLGAGDLVARDRPGVRGALRRRPTLAVAVALFAFLLGFYALTAGGHTYSSDEEGFFQQARALLDGRSNLQLGLDEQGVTSLAPGRDGGVRAGGGIGMPIAAVPLVAVGRIVAQVAPADLSGPVERLLAGFTNSWVTALLAAVVFLGAVQLGASRRNALLLALVYGVGTAAWPHAKTLFSEPLTALLVTVAVVAAIRAGSGQGRVRALAAVAGLAACAALMARISAAPFAPIIGVYLVAVTLRRAGVRSAAIAAGSFIAGAIPAVGMLLLTNQWRAGDAASTGYGAVPFTRPILEGMYGLYLSPGKSLFLYAPVALVALAALPFSARRRAPEIGLLLAIIAANTIIFARFQAWAGDHAWGPRYLYIVLPLFALLLAPVMDRVPWRRAVLVAGVVGIASAGVGAMMPHNQYITSVANRVQGPPVDGEPAYANALHFYPSYSPIVGAPRLLDDAVGNSAADLAESGDPAAAPAAFPLTTGARYFWYFQPPRLDPWWLWLVPERLPWWLLLGALPMLALCALGLRALRRSLEEPRAPAPVPAAAPRRRRTAALSASPAVALAAVATLAGGVAVATAGVRAAASSSKGSLALVSEGFGPSEPDGDGIAHWLVAPEGRLEITADAPARPRAIRLTLASFARGRRVALSIDGRPLGVVSASPTAYRELTIPLGVVAPGRHAVTLRPSPGVQPIAATIPGSADPRSVSIRLRQPASLVDAPPGGAP